MLHLSTAFQKLMEEKLTTQKTNRWIAEEEANSGINGGKNYSIMGSKSFHYKANFIEGGITQNNKTKNDVKIVVPLKYLSNFWRI